MFRTFMTFGVVAAASAAAGVTGTVWFYQSGGTAIPLSPQWAIAIFSIVYMLILLTAVLLYLITRLSIGICRLFSSSRTHV